MEKPVDLSLECGLWYTIASCNLLRRSDKVVEAPLQPWPGGAGAENGSSRYGFDIDPP
jgi:hypothetical protein